MMLAGAAEAAGFFASKGRIRGGANHRILMDKYMVRRGFGLAMYNCPGDHVGPAVGLHARLRHQLNLITTFS